MEWLCAMSACGGDSTGDEDEQPAPVEPRQFARVRVDLRKAAKRGESPKSVCCHCSWSGVFESKSPCHVLQLYTLQDTAGWSGREGCRVSNDAAGPIVDRQLATDLAGQFDVVAPAGLAVDLKNLIARRADNR